MRNLGIITEYNPFHKGHQYHLLESKKKIDAQNVVVIMSGDFTQRGEPAIYDKWIRAEMAIKNGADLVIELPFIFACNNAEYFAHGGIKILDQMGVITDISFGSESGSLDDLEKMAQILSYETDEFKETLKSNLSKGLSFPKARYETVKNLYGKEIGKLLNEPNNILGIEYLKQLILLNSPIKPFTIKRRGHSHYQSATSIRQGLIQSFDIGHIKDLVPEETLNTIKNNTQKTVKDSEKLFPLIAYKILTSTTEELAEILSSTEGLEHRLKKALITSSSYEELLKAVISKRYTITRINRLLIHSLMNLKREDFFKLKEKAPLYARVLGFSSNGAKLLREIKKKELSNIPILTNINKEVDKESPIRKLLEYDIIASNIYNLCYYGDVYSRSDHVMKPFSVDFTQEKGYN